ncbi:cyclic nucleotide-binding domain-containing protein [Streptomyces kronopolitis]|uniref:cyclic nucleotide-binding domain-containing protein n=1 Tax=Streptomyces kronopolitis TaxID=1612435 RepID=UPI0036786677
MLGLAPAHLRPARSVLLRQGDPATHVILLDCGSTLVTLTGPGGERTLLAVRGPGELLGELAVLDAKPRSASVIAAEGCLVHLIPASDFLAFVEEHGLLAPLLRHATSSVPPTSVPPFPHPPMAGRSGPRHPATPGNTSSMPPSTGATAGRSPPSSRIRVTCSTARSPPSPPLCAVPTPRHRMVFGPSGDRPRLNFLLSSTAIPSGPPCCTQPLSEAAPASVSTCVPSPSSTTGAPPGHSTAVPPRLRFNSRRAAACWSPISLADCTNMTRPPGPGWECSLPRLPCALRYCGFKR